jgi:hypothetical protein
VRWWWVGCVCLSAEIDWRHLIIIIFPPNSVDL